MTISLDYLAGYFDADGSVAITRQRNKNGHMIHQIKATLVSICPDIPMEFRNRFGGTCLVTDWNNRQNPNNRVRMDWSTTSKNCKLFLEEVVPLLVLKQDQATVALELQASLDEYPGGIKRENPEYEAVMRYRLSLYEKIRDMKKTHYLERYRDGGEFGENPNGRKRRGRPRAKQDAYAASGRV